MQVNIDGVKVQPILSYYDEHFFSSDDLPSVVVPDLRLDPQLFNISKIFEGLVSISWFYILVQSRPSHVYAGELRSSALLYLSSSYANVVLRLALYTHSHIRTNAVIHIVYEYTVPCQCMRKCNACSISGINIYLHPRT